MVQDTKKSFFANMNELVALACVKVSHYSSICNHHADIAVKNCSSDKFSDNARSGTAEWLQCHWILTGSIVPVSNEELSDRLGQPVGSKAENKNNEFSRALAQRCALPQMHNLISVGGPQMVGFYSICNASQKIQRYFSLVFHRMFIWKNVRLLVRCFPFKRVA